MRVNDVGGERRCCITTGTQIFRGGVALTVREHFYVLAPTPSDQTGRRFANSRWQFTDTSSPRWVKSGAYKMAQNSGTHHGCRSTSNVSASQEKFPDTVVTTASTGQAMVLRRHSINWHRVSSRDKQVKHMQIVPQHATATHWSNAAAVRTNQSGGNAGRAPLPPCPIKTSVKQNFVCSTCQMLGCSVAITLNFLCCVK